MASIPYKCWSWNFHKIVIPNRKIFQIGVSRRNTSTVISMGGNKYASMPHFFCGETISCDSK